MSQLSILLFLLFGLDLFAQGMVRRPIPRPKNISVSKMDDPEFPSRFDVDPKTGDWIFQWSELGKSHKYIHRPGSSIDVILEASVIRDSSGLLVYNYKINNLNTSHLGVNSFNLWLQSSDLQVNSPNKWLGNILERNRETQRINWSFTYNGLLKLPAENYKINPGDSLSGFSVWSMSLPRITPCTIAGDGGPIKAELPPPLVYIKRELNGFVRSKTVGPVAIKEPVDPQKFLSDLKKMIHESFELGWINGPITRDSLLLIVENVSKMVANHDYEAARAELRHAIVLVEEGLDKVVTSELSAIIKYNFEFLILKI